MSGGGTNTTTTQSGPPQQFLDAYENTYNQAKNVAATPYENYSGQLAAGLSPDQTAGISQVEGSTGIAAPYINSASQYINNATKPVLTPQVQGLIGGASSNFTPGNVSQWESPYTNDVVNATQAQFNNQNAIQQNQLAGNAASAGAFGGDRQAVAQSVLAGQQQANQAPAIAGLENQGYNTALGAMGTQSQLGLQSGSALLGANEAQGWLNSQAGYGMASLGQQAQNSTLTGANALLSAGGLEQQQAQQELNIPYEQYLGAQAYPFQTTGWLANIAEGLGGASGGTGTTTSPAPSTVSQLAGAGLAGAGILGSTGAFGSSGSGGAGGWLSNLFGSGASGVDGGSWDVARGGAIPHRAGGGGIAGVPDVSVSVVPGAFGLGAAPAHPGAGNLMNSSTGSTTTSDSGSNVLGPLLDIAAVASHFLARGGTVVPFRGREARHGGGIAPANDDWSDEPQRAVGGSMPISVQVVPGSYAGSPGVPQLMTGGIGGIAPTSGGAPQSVTNYLTNTAAGASHAAPSVYTPPAAPSKTDIQKMVQDLLTQQQQQQTQQQSSQNGVGGDSYEGGNARGGIIQRRDDGGEVDSAPWDNGAPPTDAGAPAPSAGIAPGPGPQAAPSGDAGSGGMPWNALLDTGLGIMSGTSPNPLTNIGRGAMAGLQQYGQQRQQQQTTALRQQEAKSLDAYRQSQGQNQQATLAETARYHKANEQVEAQRLSEQAAEAAARLKEEDKRVGIEAANSAETARYHREALDQGRYTYQPWVQPDPNDPTKTVTGLVRTPTRGDEAPAFVPMAGTPVNKSDPSATSFNVGTAAAGAHGDDYLKTLNPTLGAQVKALAEGRMAFPSGFALKSPYWQNMLQATAQYDPSFDAVNYNARSKTRGDFTSGASAKNMTSINTAIGHLGSLYDSIGGLNNTSYPAWNAVSNTVSRQGGDTSFQTAQQQFNVEKQAVADEMTRVFRGTGGNLAEIEQWQKRFDTTSSPAELKSAVGAAVNLLSSRLDALGSQYSRGMGTTADPMKLLTPKAVQTLRKLPGGQEALQEYDPSAAKSAPAGGGQSSGAAAPSWRYSATGKGGLRAFSNDGKAWFNADGTPIAGAGQ